MRTRHTSSRSLHHVRTQQEGGHPQARKRVPTQTETQLAPWPRISSLQAMLFKPPDLWYFFMVAWAAWGQCLWTHSIGLIMQWGLNKWASKRVKGKTYSQTFSFFFFFVLLGLHWWHVEVPRVGAESELQLPAYTTTTAIPDLSCISDLHCNLWQRPIHYPLREAREWTRIPVDTSQVLNPLSWVRTQREPPLHWFFNPTHSLLNYTSLWIILYLKFLTKIKIFNIHSFK